MKKLLILSDLHCGHLAGLTPPPWQTGPPGPNGRTKRAKFAPTQREAWAWYERNLAAHGPYDYVVVNGDAIDGPGRKTGGAEQITVDRQEQVDMACTAIRPAISKKTTLVMTYGTAYHTGDVEDWENDIFKELSAGCLASKIGSQEWLDIEGTIFDFRHHIGSSSIPTGRSTALNKAALWNVLWADQKYAPRANVLVRSHVHYFTATMDDVQPQLRLTTPALQAFGSRFGARRCDGLVSFGFVVFKVTKKDGPAMNYVPGHLKTQVAKAFS